MNEFQTLMEQLKFQFENGLYEDVKVMSDMLLAWSECSLEPQQQHQQQQQSQSGGESSNVGISSGISSEVVGRVGGGRETIDDNDDDENDDEDDQDNNNNNESQKQQSQQPMTSSNNNVTITNSTISSSSSSSSYLTMVDAKDKYMIYYWYANAAFNFKEYKLAETLFGKALQTNRSALFSVSGSGGSNSSGFGGGNGRNSKTKSLSTLVKNVFLKFKTSITCLKAIVLENKIRFYFKTSFKSFNFKNKGFGD